MSQFLPPEDDYEGLRSRFIEIEVTARDSGAVDVWEEFGFADSKAVVKYAEKTYMNH